MVNHVVPADQLRDAVMTLARRIALRPSFALKLAKESVNQTLEAQGQWTALGAAFSLQHLAHADNRIRSASRSTLVTSAAEVVDVVGERPGQVGQDESS